MGKRENKVETYLNNRIEFHGGITRKWTSPNRAGVPDRIVIYKGFVVFVETKSPDGKLEPHQIREHKRLTDAGASVITVCNFNEVDKLIELLINNV